MVKFLKAVTIEVTSDLIDDVPISTEETFNEDETCDADIISDTDGVAELQFGDGNVAFVNSKYVKEI